MEKVRLWMKSWLITLPTAIASSPCLQKARKEWDIWDKMMILWNSME